MTGSSCFIFERHLLKPVYRTYPVGSLASVDALRADSENSIPGAEERANGGNLNRPPRGRSIAGG
jgi:hypothetical protein